MKNRKVKEKEKIYVVGKSVLIAIDRYDNITEIAKEILNLMEALYEKDKLLNEKIRMLQLQLKAHEDLVEQFESGGW